MEWKIFRSRLLKCTTWIGCSATSKDRVITISVPLVPMFGKSTSTKRIEMEERKIRTQRERERERDKEKTRGKEWYQSR